MSEREALVEIYRAAINAVCGARSVERSLRDQPPAPGPYLVLGAGKAACAMAEGARRVLGERLVGGELVTKHGHASPVSGLRVREASHPLPDEHSVEAARSALLAAEGCGPKCGLLVLLSGGASSLWTLPEDGLSLADLRETHALLLRSGAHIGAINCVRRRLDRIKGGGLARAAGPGARLTLAISDVAGDAPEAIGSGPMSEDPSGPADALEVARRYGLLPALPARVRALLERERARAPAPRSAGEYRVVAALHGALAAALERARQLGISPVSLGASLYGEAREEAVRLAAQLPALAPGTLLVAGGEPVVHVRGDGQGGRAQELALAFALAVEGRRNVTALFAGTDGSDGPTHAAGGFADGESVARARARGLDARACLERNDSHRLLAASGDLFVTPPTRTNVNDLALILLGPAAH